MRGRLCSFLIAVSVSAAALLFPQAALAAAECFFPGGACNYSWISVGSDFSGSYSTVWTQAHVLKQSGGHLSRITMIDSQGAWQGSNADTNMVTAPGVEPPTYNKKGYCKNIADHGYTAKCTIGG